MSDLIFIIGSNSFSGSSFIDFLLSKGHSVIGISRKKEKGVLAKYSKNKFSKNFTFKKIKESKICLVSSDPAKDGKIEKNLKDEFTKIYSIITSSKKFVL